MGLNASVIVNASPLSAQFDVVSPSVAGADGGAVEAGEDDSLLVGVPQRAGADEATRAKTRLWAMINAAERLADGIGADDFDKDLFIGRLRDLANLLAFARRDRRDLENDQL